MNMPPIVLTLLPLIQLALKAAPDARRVYDDARDLFNMLFQGKLITAAEQNILRELLDEHETETLGGRIPPALTVEKDPD